MNLNVTHGRPSVYSRGCRCPVCRAGWAAYQREYRTRPAVRDRINAWQRKRQVEFGRLMAQHLQQQRNEKTDGGKP